MGRIQPTPLGLFSHVNPPQDAVGDMDAESLQKLQVPRIMAMFQIFAGETPW